MVKSCDSALALEASAILPNPSASVLASAGSIKDMKVQGSRNGRGLVMSELLASACSASDPLDRSCMSWSLHKARGAQW